MKISYEYGELILIPESDSEKQRLIETFGGIDYSCITTDLKGGTSSTIKAANSHEIELNENGSVTVQVRSLASNDE